MAKSGFSACDYDGRKAIKFYHDFGDFDFLLIQAEDGSKDIQFIIPSAFLPKHTLNKIGKIALSHLRSTAKLLHYPIPDDTPTFQDALNILDEAEIFLRTGTTRRQA